MVLTKLLSPYFTLKNNYSLEQNTTTQLQCSPTQPQNHYQPNHSTTVVHHGLSSTATLPCHPTTSLGSRDPCCCWREPRPCPLSSPVVHIPTGESQYAMKRSDAQLQLTWFPTANSVAALSLPMWQNWFW